MVPGLALWLPSGYSWGAALLLLCALASAGVWLHRPLARPSWLLLLAMLGMGSLWLLDMRDGWLSREFDKPSKYFLALPCLAYALAFAPVVRWRCTKPVCCTCRAPPATPTPSNTAT